MTPPAGGAPPWIERAPRKPAYGLETAVSAYLVELILMRTGLDGKQLAREIGTSEARLSRIRNRKARVSLGEAARIVRTAGLELAIVRGSDPWTPGSVELTGQQDDDGERPE